MQVGDQTKQIASAQLPTPFVGTFSRDTTLASGTQAVTGVGFTPSGIIVFGHDTTGGQLGEGSWGMSDGITHKALFDNSNVTLRTWDSNGTLIFMRESGSVSYTAVLTSFDTDGFTVTWTRNSTPSGTFSISFMAFK